MAGDQPNEEVPKHMRRVFDDAMERAGMRRFTESMEDALEATKFVLGYTPPEWQMRWLTEFAASDGFRASLDYRRLRDERDDIRNRAISKAIEQAIKLDIGERESMYHAAISLTDENRRGTLFAWQEADGNWRVACMLPGAGQHAMKTFIDEFYESSVQQYNKIAERWL